MISVVRKTKNEIAYEEFSKLAVGHWEAMSPKERSFFRDEESFKYDLFVFHKLISNLSDVNQIKLPKREDVSYLVDNDIICSGNANGRYVLYWITPIGNDLIRKFLTNSSIRNYIEKYYVCGEENSGGDVLLDVLDKNFNIKRRRR